MVLAACKLHASCDSTKCSMMRRGLRWGRGCCCKLQHVGPLSDLAPGSLRNIRKACLHVHRDANHIRISALNMEDAKCERNRWRRSLKLAGSRAATRSETSWYDDFGTVARRKDLQQGTPGVLSCNLLCASAGRSLRHSPHIWLENCEGGFSGLGQSDV